MRRNRKPDLEHVFWIEKHILDEAGNDAWECVGDTSRKCPHGYVPAMEFPSLSAARAYAEKLVAGAGDVYQICYNRRLHGQMMGMPEVKELVQDWDFGSLTAVAVD